MADLLVADNLRAAGRIALLGLLFWLPAPRRRTLERWLRGREEFCKLQRADWVLMSWGKSGRTWLRVMLSRAYTLMGDLPSSELLDFDNLRRRDARLPAVFFTHNNYLRDYTGNYESKAHFAGRKMVLLVRDPRDVAVSQYFQWQYRMRPVKKFINGYPPEGAEVDAWTFVTDPTVGVPRIVDYFNDWAASREQLDDLLIVRYEDMRADPGAVLRRILDFTGTPATPQQIDEAVSFAAYDNMKKMEREAFFKGSGARVRPADQDNPASFKVRKAKVGGYREHFDETQCAALAGMVATLDPVFGYGEESAEESAVESAVEGADADAGRQAVEQTAPEAAKGAIDP